MMDERRIAMELIRMARELVSIDMGHDVVRMLNSVHKSARFATGRGPKSVSGGRQWEFWSDNDDIQLEAEVYIKNGIAEVTIVHVGKQDGTRYREVVDQKSARIDDDEKKLLVLVAKVVRAAKPNLEENIIRYM